MFVKNFFFAAGPKYSWKKVSCILLLSSSLCVGLTVSGYLIKSASRDLQKKNVEDKLQALVQTGLQSSAHTGMQFSPLPTGLLAEILNLSADCTVSLKNLDLREAQDRLLSTHIMENIRVKKMKPNLLFVDYTLREPWVYLEDYSNTVIDSKGNIFPLIPFYSPRSLPKIYLGEQVPSCPWGTQMCTESLLLAQKVCSSLPFNTIHRIDLSQSGSQSAGKREIVVILKEGTILRIAPKNCVQQLAYYTILKNSHFYGENPNMIIDLRIPEVAYMQKI